MVTRKSTYLCVISVHRMEPAMETSTNILSDTTSLDLHDVLDETFQVDGSVAPTLDYRLNLAQRLYKLQTKYFVLSCLYCKVEVAIALECSVKSALRW